MWQLSLLNGYVLIVSTFVEVKSQIFNKKYYNKNQLFFMLLPNSIIFK
jgi:hypothetical protein